MGFEQDGHIRRGRQGALTAGISAAVIAANLLLAPQAAADTTPNTDTPPEGIPQTPDELAPVTTTRSTITRNTALTIDTAPPSAADPAQRSAVALGGHIVRRGMQSTAAPLAKGMSQPKSPEAQQTQQGHASSTRTIAKGTQLSADPIPPVVVDTPLDSQIVTPRLKRASATLANTTIALDSLPVLEQSSSSLVVVAAPLDSPAASTTTKKTKQPLAIDTLPDVSAVKVPTTNTPLANPVAAPANTPPSKPEQNIAPSSQMVFPMPSLTDSLRRAQHPERWPSGNTDNVHHHYNAADIFAPTGTPIVSPFAGTVLSAHDFNPGDPNRVVGSTVQVRVNAPGTKWEGMTLYFAHMGHNTLQVKPGDLLQAGSPIGAVGTRADAQGTETHLHIDLVAMPNRPLCSDGRCAAYPFQNIQALLSEAWGRQVSGNGNVSTQTAPTQPAKTDTNTSTADQAAPPQDAATNTALDSLPVIAATGGDTSAIQTEVVNNSGALPVDASPTSLKDLMAIPAIDSADSAITDTQTTPTDTQSPSSDPSAQSGQSPSTQPSPSGPEVATNPGNRPYQSITEAKVQMLFKDARPSVVHRNWSYYGFYLDKVGLGDRAMLTYSFATLFVEQQPFDLSAEGGKGAGHSYGNVDPTTGYAYYGRGNSQLTWKDNYRKYGRKVNIVFKDRIHELFGGDVDLVNNPDLLTQSAELDAMVMALFMKDNEKAIRLRYNRAVYNAGSNDAVANGTTAFNHAWTLIAKNWFN